MFASTAILGALHHRDQTGQGQRVDVSLLESVVALLINVASSYLMTGEAPTRYGNAHPNLVPYQQFQTSDGAIIIGAGNDRQFRDLCRALAVPALADDERFKTNADRVANRAALIPALQHVVAEKPSAIWVERLLEVGVMAAPINTLPEVFADPQVLHRQMLMELDHPTLGPVRISGIPYKLGATPASGRRHPPLLGEHTGEVLRDLLGLEDDQIATLKDEGAI
jgi:crotonobetainyl-CoA:carnitine CoA-transferase CaiB-like acyl-CoA transferase